MLKSIKTYFKDYAVAQKACNEFNKKHWFGNIVLSLLIGGGTCVAFYEIDKHYENKRKKIDNLCDFPIEEE